MSHSLLDQIRDVYARESIKMLIDKVMILEKRIQQGDVNVDMEGGNPKLKHARTHASLRAGVIRSGSDPLDEYGMDWKKDHNFQPDLPDTVPLTISPHPSQSVNLVEIKDSLLNVQDTVDPEGNVTVRGAAVKGAMNLGHGAKVVNPLSIAGLEFWFDASTIPDDNDGIEYDDPIGVWIDRTKTYTGSPSYKESDETGPIWRKRRFRGKLIGAVDCHSYEPNDDVDGDFPSTAASPNEISKENGVDSFKWFQIEPEYTANDATTITVIACVRQPLLKPAGTDSILIGNAYVPYPPGGLVGFADDKCWLTPWGYSTNHPPLTTYPTLKVLESGGAGGVQVGVAQVANDPMPQGGGGPTGGTGMGFWQIVTFVLEPVTLVGSTQGRKAKLVRLNGTDQTIGTGAIVGSQDTSAVFNIKHVLGPNLEGRHIAVFEGELSLANIQAVENYFSGRDEDWNEHEFAESVEGLGAQYNLTLQKDENNWCGLRTDSKGVVRYDTSTNATTDRSRFQIKPKVIPSANFPAEPGTDFDEGELVWCDYGSTVAALLAVVDTDGAGTLGWREIWRT